VIGKEAGDEIEAETSGRERIVEISDQCTDVFHDRLWAGYRTVLHEPRLPRRLLRVELCDAPDRTRHVRLLVAALGPNIQTLMPGRTPVPAKFGGIAPRGRPGGPPPSVRSGQNDSPIVRWSAPQRAEVPAIANKTSAPATGRRVTANRLIM